MTSICPWCAAMVVGHPALCPACGLLLCAGPDQPEHATHAHPARAPDAIAPDVPDLQPLPSMPVPTRKPEPEAPPRDRPQAPRHGWRILLPLACFIAGGALGLLGAAEIQPILSSPAADPQPSTQAHAQTAADITERARAAVLGQLTFPAAMLITSSFVITTAGGLATVCGALHPRDHTDMKDDIRFLSVNGDRSRTFLEVSEPSFAVLWARLCVPNSGLW